MFKSIFTRLLATYLLLTLMITGSLALILSYGFNHHIYMEKKRVLSAAAVKVEDVMNDYYQGMVQPGEMQIALDTLGFISDSTIYALKVDIKTLNNPQNKELEAELAEDYLLDDLRNILDGQDVYRKKQFSRALATDVVFWGTPLRIDEEIKGAILIFSPLEEINTYLAQINAIIGATALAALIFGFFFISITAARISKPIRAMDQAARRLAAGEHVKDVDIHTGDEVEGLADSFNYMKSQVEAVEHMRREFIANVSHELRTPLTSINGFIQGMLDGLVQPAEYTRYLRLVQDETQRLIRLTGDILELAKLQSGNIRLKRSIVIVREILEKVLASFDIPSQHSGIIVNLECDEELTVWADPDRSQQILHNLIANALRYTPDGGSISIKVQEQGGAVMWNITDTGAGIEKEELPYVFERFYKDNKSVQGHTGSGLGLSITKNLVEMHGGSIQVESEPGKGTSFIFQIPG